MSRALQVLFSLLILSGFYLGCWQWNHMLSWWSWHVPVYWVAVFFPAMRLPGPSGLIVVLLAGLAFEARGVELRGWWLPGMVALFWFLQMRRQQTMELRRGMIVFLASVSHLATCLYLTTGMALLQPLWREGERLGVRLFQDWLLGQLVLFLILPVLWMAFGWVREKPVPIRMDLRDV
jgi:hypothetical protein